MAIIMGYFEKIISKNYATGICRIGVRPLQYSSDVNQWGCLIFEGIIPNILQDSPVCVEYEETYKNQNNETIYKIKKIELSIDDESTLMNYITKNIKGIGEKKAKKIIEIVGTPFITNIKNETTQQVLVKEKINTKTIADIIQLFKNNSALFELHTYLNQFQCHYSLIVKLNERYGDNALSLVKQNPYQILSFFDVPFLLQDEIAYQEHIPAQSPHRIKGICYAIMHMNEKKGNTCLPISINQIKKKISNLLKKSPYKQNPSIIDILDEFRQANYVIEEKDEDYYIYRKHTYYAESSLIFHYNRISKSPHLCCNITTQDIEQSLLAEEQKEALLLLKTTGIKILTGGPGSGKTTTIKEIIRLYKKYNPHKILMCCAPTGRAAARMQEATGESSQTIHKLLDLKPYTEDFDIKEDPLPCDCLIIDEVSMLGIELMEKILKRCKNNILILLVGDENQIPSIEVGNVLHDMLSSNQYEVVRLKKNYRQANNTTILDNAYKIFFQNGELVFDESFRIQTVSENTLYDVLANIYQEKDTYLLTPTKMGVMGTYACNQYLQSLLFPKTNYCITYGSVCYYVGDRVMFIRNNYQEEETWCNGDIGYITEIREEDILIQVDKRCISLPKIQLDEITLAYAMTIHKSQGSESKKVILLLPKEYKFMLNKYLLFTALTRAKNEVVVLIEDDSFHAAFKGGQDVTRISNLSDKLKGVSIPTLS